MNFIGGWMTTLTTLFWYPNVHFTVAFLAEIVLLEDLDDTSSNRDKNTVWGSTATVSTNNGSFSRRDIIDVIQATTCRE